MASTPRIRVQGADHWNRPVKPCPARKQFIEGPLHVEDYSPRADFVCALPLVLLALLGAFLIEIAFTPASEAPASGQPATVADAGAGVEARHG